MNCATLKLISESKVVESILPDNKLFNNFILKTCRHFAKKSSISLLVTLFNPELDEEYLGRILRISKMYVEQVLI